MRDAIEIAARDLLVALQDVGWTWDGVTGGSEAQAEEVAQVVIVDYMQALILDLQASSPTIPSSEDVP